MNFWQRISQLDRRWIYLAVALAVIFPLFVPMKMPLGITPEARQLYDAIEALPESSVVMLTFDYYPSTVAETRPMSIAALHQMFRKNLKVITMTTIPLGGPSMADRTMKMMAEQVSQDLRQSITSISDTRPTTPRCCWEWGVRLSRSIRPTSTARRWRNCR